MSSGPFSSIKSKRPTTGDYLQKTSESMLTYNPSDQISKVMDIKDKHMNNTFVTRTEPATPSGVFDQQKGTDQS